MASNKLITIAIENIEDDYNIILSDNTRENFSNLTKVSDLSFAIKMLVYYCTKPSENKLIISLVEQLTNWFEATPNSQKYRKPLSDKQILILDGKMQYDYNKKQMVHL